MSEKAKTIRIRRAAHDKENPYYLASRATAQNKVLSYEALGMLHYILSKPDDWQVQPSDLEREKCKRNQVYKILNQLIDAGYIERIYHRNKLGRIEWVEYIAHEIAQPFPENQEMDNPQMEKQHTTDYIENKVQNKQPPNPRKRGDGKPQKSYASQDALIIAWAEASGLLQHSMGATVTDKYSRKVASELLGWEKPPTTEEIRAAVQQYNPDVRYGFGQMKNLLLKYRKDCTPTNKLPAGMKEIR